MARQIWKDFYVVLGEGDSFDYRILADNEIIYQGKAYRRAAEGAVSIKVNEVCANYIGSHLPELMSLSWSSVSKTFDVQVLRGSAWVSQEQFSFYNNWSYSNSDKLSAQVWNKVAPGQWMFISLPASGGNSILVQFPGNTYSISRTATEGIGVVKAEKKYSSVTIDGVKYDYVPCCRYVLYYANALGGWDWLVIEGNYKEEDDVTRNERSISYNNAVVSNRGREHYLAQITKRMTLHTSWMSDMESQKMHHLLNSTNVYLHDLNSDEIIPVLLTNTTTEYKTYKGNGGQLVNYAIEVEFANRRIRR